MLFNGLRVHKLTSSLLRSFKSTSFLLFLSHLDSRQFDTIYINLSINPANMNSYKVLERYLYPLLQYSHFLVFCMLFHAALAR